MAALLRLGVSTGCAGLRIRVSPQIAVCNALHARTLAPVRGHRTCSDSRKNLYHSAPELREFCIGTRHAAPLTAQLWRLLHISHNQNATKGELKPAKEEVGRFIKIMEAMGFTGPLKYRKWKIKIAALRMYASCVDKIDYDAFLERCSLPDTFNSWFLVTQLHVWMCLVRLKQEGRAGKYMCRYVVYCMWEDVYQRGKVMGVHSASFKNDIKELTKMFYASIFGYDEGIMSDDKTLAGALWRHLFHYQCDDPRKLELMVEYVRKQIQFLDSLNGEDLLLSGSIVWRPLVETDPQSILKPSAPTYNDEGL